MSYLYAGFWLQRFELHMRVMLREIKFRSEYDLAEYLLLVHNFNVNMTPVRSVIHSVLQSFRAIAKLESNKYKERHTFEQQNI